MQKLVILLVLIVLISAKYKPELKGSGYQSKSAEEKMQINKQRIKQKYGTHGTWPGAFQLSGLFTQNNDLTFSVQDDMPTQGLWNSKRPKLIHIIGTIAEVEYVSVSNKYSGLFAKGATKGFGRFSMATQPEKKTKNIAPGMSFKWFRDGVPSANWFCLFALQGFNNHSNVFYNDYSNHIPQVHKNAGFKFKAIVKKFESASDWPAFVGLSDTASYDQQGKKSEKVNFPFRLQFQPSKEARNFMADDLKIDDYYFLRLLEGWKTDNLFNVYAQESPESEKLELIGHVRMKTPFKESSYIDDTMFFGHQRFEDDLKIKPQWKKPAQKVLDRQGNQKNAYTFPNIPYE